MTVLPLCAFACVDPRADYDDYLARTETQRGPIPVAVSDASFEGAAPDGGFSSDYYVACLPSIALGNLQKTLKFRASVVYTATNTINITMYPIKAGAADLSETIGAPLVKNDTPVTADGKFVADFGTPGIDGPANPISGNPITFGKCIMEGYLTEPPAKFCAELNALIVKPSEISLEEPGDACRFWKIEAPSGPLPPIKKEDFVCP